MYQNYILTAFRSSKRNLLFSIINIGGLTIGLAVCILVFLFIERELNWDSWIEEPDDIYRMEARMVRDGNINYFSSMMYPLRNAIKEKIPEVDYATRLQYNSWTIQRGDAVFFEEISTVDQDFLEIFDLNFVRGSKENALNDLNSIVLTESLAEKYFGTDDPIGRTLTINERKEMRVTGVVANFPDTSTIGMEGFARYEASGPYDNDWNSNSPQIYVSIGDPAKIPAITAVLDQIVIEHKIFMEDDEPDPLSIMRLYPQPMMDVHIKSSGRTTKNPYGNLAMLYGYVAIALLILVISCINYVNLSTARAMKRTKEVCLRKVMGASRKQVITQFIGETVLLALIALIIALALVELIMPFMEGFIDGELSLNLLSNINLWFLMVGLIIFTGGIAGIYPAIFVSSFEPARFLHSNQSSSGPGTKLRNVLVVLQFTIAIGLISLSSIIMAQMKLANELDLGFNQEDIIVLRGTNRQSAKDHVEALKQQLLTIAGVESVTRAYNVPTDGRYSGRTAKLKGTNPEKAPGLRILPSEYNFLETLETTLITGRFLNEKFGNDNVIADDSMTDDTYPDANAVINESAVTELGFDSPEDALGKVITIRMGYGSGGAHFTIVGVIKDFRFGSVKRGIDEMIFYRQDNRFDQMAIKVTEGSLPGIKSEIERVWKSVYPNLPIRQDVLSDRFDRELERESSQADLFLGFSFVAIILSCMGLLGLAVFTAENRTKEIGVRKVHGARALDIVWLLTWQFSRPILLSNILAIPIAWYFADQWLENFSERIDISPMYFIVGGAIALTIGLVTVAGHAWRAASTHPVYALRYE